MRPRSRRRRREERVGDPVKVANARNQAEAEFIQALLREEGIPSMLRRSPGFDVPDFLELGRGMSSSPRPPPISRAKF